MYSSEQCHGSNEAHRTPTGSTARTRRECDQESGTARTSHCGHVLGDRIGHTSERVSASIVARYSELDRVYHLSRAGQVGQRWVRTFHPARISLSDRYQTPTSDGADP